MAESALDRAALGLVPTPVPASKMRRGLLTNASKLRDVKMLCE